MERDHRNYFGQTAQPFVVVSEFEKTPTQIHVAFDGFASAEAFDAGAEPLPNLRRDFTLNGARLAEFVVANKDLLAEINRACLSIARVPDDYELVQLQLYTIRWVMVLHAVSPAGDDSVVRTKTAPEYHSIVASNIETVGRVLATAWAFGKDNDSWLASLNSAENK